MRRAAAVVLVVMLMTACSSRDNGYTEDVRQAFLTSCTHNEGQPANFCGCFFDEIMRRVPFDRYVELDKEMQKDDKLIPDEYVPLAADCASRSSSSSS